MAYLKKNIEALIDVKITDKGRELISTGKFCNIEYFQVGDSEFDYKNEEIFKRDGSAQTQIVLRAKDKDNDIKYPIPVFQVGDVDTECQTYGRLIPNHQDEIVTKDVEFLGATQHQIIKTPLGICTPIHNFDGDDTLVTSETISCEYIMVKFPQDPSNVLDSTGLCLWYKVIRFIDANTIQLDRKLPDYSNIGDFTSEATIFQYAKRETTEYVDFNTVWTEEFAGFDDNLPRTYSDGNRYVSSKELFGYTSNNHDNGVVLCENNIITTTTTTICPPERSVDIEVNPGTVQVFTSEDTGSEWGYCSSFKDSYGATTKVYPTEQKVIGVIHYTKWEDYYGTGEWWEEADTEFELNLPTLMYHRDTNNGGVMGHKFSMGIERKYVKSLVNDEMDVHGDVYYDLKDGTTSKNVVGKVFPHKQVIIIDDEEILMALSMKSNRNYTLPAPKVVKISADSDCIDSDNDPLLPKELTHEVYVSYMFYNRHNKTYSAPCAQYVKVVPKSDDDYDVAVSFKDGFQFLRDKTILSDDAGYQATDFHILIQRVVVGEKPIPSNWKMIDFTNNLVGHLNGSNISPSHITGTKFIITTETYSNGLAFVYRDLIGYPDSDEKGNLIFGDEFMLMGDITLRKQHTTYVMNFMINLPQGNFNRSLNPTWDLSDNKTDDSRQGIKMTEVALYNVDKDMVAIGKISKPHKRTNSSQVISVKLDF